MAFFTDLLSNLGQTLFEELHRMQIKWRNARIKNMQEEHEKTKQEVRMFVENGIPIPAKLKQKTPNAVVEVYLELGKSNLIYDLLPQYYEDKKKERKFLKLLEIESFLDDNFLLLFLLGLFIFFIIISGISSC